MPTDSRRHRSSSLMQISDVRCAALASVRIPHRISAMKTWPGGVYT
jgi:hypothetical protein